MNVHLVSVSEDHKPRGRKAIGACDKGGRRSGVCVNWLHLRVFRRLGGEGIR